jgi:hypothetical protein
MTDTLVSVMGARRHPFNLHEIPALLPFRQLFPKLYRLRHQVSPLREHRWMSQGLHPLLHPLLRRTSLPKRKRSVPVTMKSTTPSDTILLSLGYLLHLLCLSKYRLLRMYTTTFMMLLLLCLRRPLRRALTELLLLRLRLRQQMHYQHEDGQALTYLGAKLILVDQWTLPGLR